MNGTLSPNLVKISEWTRVNRVSFNATKSQSGLLTPGQSNGQSRLFGSVNIEQSAILDVLSVITHTITMFVGQKMYSNCGKAQSKA